MRAVTAAILAMFALAGCLGSPSVRTVLLTESFAFGEGAPADAFPSREGVPCSESSYDAREPRIHLAPGSRPTFVIVTLRSPDSRGPSGEPDPRAGEYRISTYGEVTGPEVLEPATTIVEEKADGATTMLWASGFRGASGIGISWTPRKVEFQDEPLREGVTVSRSYVDNVTFQNASFTFAQNVSAMYLGRVHYSTEDRCAAR